MNYDVRKNYVLKTSATFFELPASTALESYHSDLALNRFLDSSENTILRVELNGTSLVLSNKPAKNDSSKDSISLLFLKVNLEPIDDLNYKNNILVTSVASSSFLTLYVTLQRIYAPILEQGSKESVEPQLANTIRDLEATLRSSLFRDYDANPAASIIRCTNDEVAYWNDSRNPEITDSTRKKIIRLVKQLEAELKTLRENVETDGDEALENVYNILDDIWKIEDIKFPQDHMENILNIIGNELITSLRSDLSHFDPLHDQFEKVEFSLKNAESLCTKWINICEKLTNLFWPNYALNAWTSGLVMPELVSGFKSRLQDIYSIRLLHAQVMSLFSTAEQKELSVQLFKPEPDFDPLSYNCFTEIAWKKYLESTKRGLKDVEDKAAIKAKIFLEASWHQNILQLLQKLDQWSELLRRPGVQAALATELQNLSQQVANFVSDLTSKTFQAHEEVFGTSEVVLNLYRVKQAQNKISEVTEFSSAILKGVNGYEELMKTLAESANDFKEKENKLFNAWTRQALSDLRANRFGVDKGEPVVSFEHGKLMRVNYSSELLRLIRETRQISLLGFHVNSEVLDVAGKAKEFLQHAKILMQVATFHNTIGDRMINSQRSMMLASARDLSRLVQSQNTVTWENPKQVDEYVKKLQKAVDKLGNENNKLVYYHKIIMSKVVTLMDIDLIKQGDSWKKIVYDIKAIISEVEEKYSGSAHWRTHIDYQIYKALESQYQLSLLSFDDLLPEFHLELIFKNQKLQYRPSIYKIKKEFFKKVQVYLCKPQHMQGVGGLNIYAAIVEYNAERYFNVFKRSEYFFNRLESFMAQWRPWVALNNENIDDYINEALETVDDFERNFRASKMFGQQLATLPSTCSIGPFSISLDSLRNNVEIQNRRYWSSLTSSLRASIFKETSSIDSFINKAQSALHQQPQKIEDIGEAHYNYRQITEESRQISVSLENVIQKNELLRAWTKENVSRVSDVTGAWSNFQVSLANFDLFMSKQSETLKAKLVSVGETLKNEMKRFALKWSELQPSETKLMEPNVSETFFNDTLQMIRDNRNTWEEMVTKAAKTREEFVKMDMQPPNFDAHPNVMKELDKCIEVWSLYERFTSGLRKLGAEEWIVVRAKAYQLTDGFLEQWTENIAQIPESSITAKIKLEIEQLRELLPFLQYLRGETFTERHWLQVFSLLGQSFKPIDKIMFRDFLLSGKSIVNNSDTLKAINVQAAGEIVIRQALSELDTWEIEAKFDTFDHTDSKGMSIVLITDYKSVIDKIGEYQSLLQSVKLSSNASQFSDRVALWEDRLALLYSILRDLNQVQRKWAYLEPVFSSGALDHSRFERIDKEWRFILSQTSKAQYRVASLSKITNLGSTLHQIVQSLLQCQRMLQDFLEEKRLQFPRFYFINDDDLLEILGQAKKRNVIQSHLKKIFSGISSVEVENDVIKAIISSHGESFALRNHVPITDQVEKWLENLSDEMKETLKSLLRTCIEKPDPVKYPSQILCLAERINFTKSCEQAISTGGLKKFQSQLKEVHANYTRQLMNWTGDRRDQNSNVLELKLKALLVDAIYHLNVVNNLISNGVKSIGEWAWQNILRFYCNETGRVTVKMVYSEFDYTYEYVGNQATLVHTSLTDKCYLTLTQAVSMGFGGNPYGPAGTGKTESVKALGALLGRQVLVFNCDEGLDAHSLTRIMVGLVKSGAWGCFDEFNRLEETTLSLISLQIHIIQQALRTHSNSITLLGKEVGVNHNTGIFITLNPAAKGYGGRQKLPENLKQLFRPILMSKPDDIDIARVILHCEGFSLAEEIGYKLVTLFNLARSLLSQQQHYDFGLRALKTVVGSCGNALKAYLKMNQKADDKAELELAVNAVRLNTLCKLTYEDRSRFECLLSDLFTGVLITPSGSDDIKKAVADAVDELGLTFYDRQSHKCIELYEQLEQRMGVMVVGPPGSGKTTVINLLKSALVSQGITLRHDVIVPKAMPRQQLLGHIDADTRQWNDGVLTSIAQAVYNEPQNVKCWIHFDGEVDPEWIESLNSVLDENHLLTLPSGSRIQFGDNVNFIFETHDLTYASPATISRMGMILLSEEDLNMKMVVDAWLGRQSEEPARPVVGFVRNYLCQILDWCTNNDQLNSEASLSSIIDNFLSVINTVTSKAEFCVSVINVLSSYIKPSSKDVFIKMVMDVTGEGVLGSAKFLYYDYSSDTIRGNMNSLTDEDSDITFTPQLSVSRDLVLSWLRNQKQFILIGPPGCGKRILLDYCFAQLENVEVVCIDCSSYVSPNHVLQKLNKLCAAVSTNSRRVLRPRNTEFLIVYIPDIHMAFSDKYETKMLLEFFRQAADYRGYYDTNLEWISIENINFVYSAHSIHGLSPRFVAINFLHHLDLPSDSELRDIFTSRAKKLFSEVNSTKITSAMLNLYENLNNSFGKNRNCPISPRDLSKWMSNLLRYNLSDGACRTQAFVNEAKRIFRDRLVNLEDINTFDDLLLTTIKSHFEIEQISAALEVGQEKHGWVIILDVWNFGSFLEPISLYHGSLTMSAEGYFVCENPTSNHSLVHPLIRLDSKDWAKLVKQVNAQNGSDDHTLIVPDLMELTARIDCSLSEPAGGVFLAGKLGAGRKTAVNIVALRRSATVFSPKIGEKYTAVNFKSDLKSAFQLAGINNEQVFLLLEDHQILFPEFLNMVNSMVASGEVLGLYQAEELDSIVAVLKEAAVENDYEGPLTQFFLKSSVQLVVANCILLNTHMLTGIRQNIHVVIVFDFKDQHFIEQLKSNQALIKHCYHICNVQFSDETMTTIPKSILEREPNLKEFLGNAENQTFLVESFKKIHNSASNYLPNLTPLSYFALVRTYIRHFNEKVMEISGRKQQLKAGVNKIAEAKALVDKLKSEASEQKLLLNEKQSKAKLVLDKISDTMARASMKKNEMENLKHSTEIENRTLQARKEEIDRELAEIKPLIEEAQAAVGNIKSESLSEIRSLRAPPQVIRDILEGVLRLQGIQDMSWNSMKSFLASRGVKEEIRYFDASQITSDNRKAVERLLETHKESFDVRNAKRASIAAAPLAEWVKANVKYSKVLDKIKPLKQEQLQLERNLALAGAQIEELGTGLLDVDNVVSHLKDQLNSSTKEAAEIEVHLANAQKTLSAAETLVSKLNDEFSVWSQQLSDISSSFHELFKNCLLSAAFVTYLPNASEGLRRMIVHEWKKSLEFSNDFGVNHFLSSERNLLQWVTEGLANDEYCLQNAVVALNSEMPMLIYDPSSMVKAWLEKHFQNVTVEVISQLSPKFVKSVELSVRFGKLLIVEDVDSIPPILMPLIRGNYVYQGPRKMVYIGPKVVDFNENFKLFLTSRSTVYNSETVVNNTFPILNFGVTQDGLNQQLLTSALYEENPRLQERRVELLVDEEKLKTKLHFLQEMVLKELADSQGDILQNEELLASLNDTKNSSVAIQKSLAESSEIKKDMAKECEAYQPLADFGTKLFFACRSLDSINNMYYLSVASFVALFRKNVALTKGAKSSPKEKCQSLLSLTYYYVSRSLFKCDRLSFALHLVSVIRPELLLPREWSVFIDQSFHKMSETDSASKSLPDWIDKDRLPYVQLLKEDLPEFFESLKLENGAEWSQFLTSSPPRVPKFLNPTEFQLILLLQTFRPERLYHELRNFAMKQLGLKSLSPSTLELRDLFSDTSETEPILIITTPGTDPSQELTALASMLSIQNVGELVVGPGQEENILGCLKGAAKSGAWVILKNLHLLTSWLPSLEKEIQLLGPRHKNFRLWLTTETHHRFSKILLSSCTKITYEAPPGIRRNLERTYNEWSSHNFLDAQVETSQAMFVLAWFHAVVQERRTYIPQGWNCFYEFNDTDLTVAAAVVKRVVSSRNAAQWDYIHGLFECAVYGGRVNNIYDLRVISAYLKNFFNSEVIGRSRKPLMGNLLVPSSSKIEDHLALIRTVPETDSPEFFGLPKNVSGIWQRVACLKLMQQLKDFGKLRLNEDKSDMKLFNTAFVPLLKMWKRINQGHGFIYGKPPESRPEAQPLDAFFSLELEFSINLITTIHKDLVELNKAMKNGIFPKKQMELTACSLANQQVPDQWIRMWNGPNNPKIYLQNALSRAIKIQHSHENWTSPSGSTIEMSQFFNANKFIIALRQQASRHLKVPIHLLKLHNSWGVREACLKEGSVIISDILLEGAILANGSFEETLEDSLSVSSTPPLLLSWIEMNHNNVDCGILVPLYVNEHRENVIAELEVPCSPKETNKWITAGVAFYTQS